MPYVKRMRLTQSSSPTSSARELIPPFGIRWLSTSRPLTPRSVCLSTSCVPSTAPLFSEDDLKARVHINAIGSYTPTMFEFPPTLISASSSGDDGTSSRIPTILVDSRAACLHEAGELIAAGIGPEDLIEIGELCDERGQLKADTETAAKVDRLRRGSRKQTLFKCVGVGSMDVAVTRLVVEAARKRGLGTSVDF